MITIIFSVASASVASESTDKCAPCLWSGDLYSTKTGRLLQEMFMPLMSILQEICRCCPKEHGKGHGSFIHFEFDLVFTE